MKESRGLKRQKKEPEKSRRVRQTSYFREEHPKGNTKNVNLQKEGIKGYAAG